MDQTIGSFGESPVLNQKLVRLELQISSLEDIHFSSIELCLPKLKTIILSSDRVLSDKCLKYLSKLSELRHLEINSFNCVLNPISNSGIHRVLKSCPKIETIILKLNTNITEKCFKKCIEFSEKRKKVLLKLIFVTKNHLTIDSKVFRKTKNLLIKDFTKEFYDKYNYF